jgi:hypothetical protein
MATFTLQTLELRAALLTGARATGQGSKGQRTAMGSNPVEVLSLPWHPLPGHPSRIGPESVEGHRTSTTYSMDTLDRRAGRSAGSAGVAGDSCFARLRGRTILSTWSVPVVVAKSLCG